MSKSAVQQNTTSRTVSRTHPQKTLTPLRRFHRTMRHVVAGVTASLFAIGLVGTLLHNAGHGNEHQALTTISTILGVVFMIMVVALIGLLGVWIGESIHYNRFQRFYQQADGVRRDRPHNHEFPGDSRHTQFAACVRESAGQIVVQLDRYEPTNTRYHLDSRNRDYCGDMRKGMYHKEWVRGHQELFDATDVVGVANAYATMQATAYAMEQQAHATYLQRQIEQEEEQETYLQQQREIKGTLAAFHPNSTLARK